VSNVRKLRQLNRSSGQAQRNKREWSGQPGNPTTQVKMAQALAAEAADRKKPRFVLRPKKQTDSIGSAEEQADVINATGA
jgi:hypothetical protein